VTAHTENTRVTLETRRLTKSRDSLDVVVRRGEMAAASTALAIKRITAW
jgi:hypothetical protein